MARDHRSYYLGYALTFVLLSFTACGGKSAVDAQNAAVNGTGGANAGNGGSTADVLAASGGAGDGTLLGSGGAMSTHAETAGAPSTTMVSGGGVMGSGGIASSTGGASVAGQGGVVGAGGSVAIGGSSAKLDCAKTTCPAIPKSCKKLVQDPNACCPTCLDTGCGACHALICEAGTHAEVVVGDCCPTCVNDPPDPCLVDQKNYADSRASMLEKYGSIGCSNSSDCTLVLEDTACAYVCNVALPTQTARTFTSNSSTPWCSTCAAPPRVTCPNQVPACLNGKCVAVDTPRMP
jgi:hypothetical protein